MRTGTIFERAQLSYEQRRYADAASLVEYADALRKLNRGADAATVEVRAASPSVSQRLNRRVAVLRGSAHRAKHRRSTRSCPRCDRRTGTGPR